MSGLSDLRGLQLEPKQNIVYTKQDKVIFNGIKET